MASEYIFQESGDRGQICAFCNVCQNQVYYGWYAQKNSVGKYTNILCTQCYDHMILGHDEEEIIDDSEFEPEFIKCKKKNGHDYTNTKQGAKCIECKVIYNEYEENHCCCRN